MGKNLDGILKSVNDAAQGPQLKKALTDLSVMIASAQTMIRNLDTKQLPELVSGLQKTLTSANKLVLSLDSGYGDNTKFSRDLDRLLVLLGTIENRPLVGELRARRHAERWGGRAAGSDAQPHLDRGVESASAAKHDLQRERSRDRLARCHNRTEFPAARRGRGRQPRLASPGKHQLQGAARPDVAQFPICRDAADGRHTGRGHRGQYRGRPAGGRNRFDAGNGTVMHSRLRSSADRPTTQPQLRECPGCGLLQTVPALAPGMPAHCARCPPTLRRTSPHRLDHIVALPVPPFLLFVPMS